MLLFPVASFQTTLHWDAAHYLQYLHQVNHHRRLVTRQIGQQLVYLCKHTKTKVNDITKLGKTKANNGHIAVVDVLQIMGWRVKKPDHY